MTTFTYMIHTYDIEMHPELIEGLNQLEQLILAEDSEGFRNLAAKLQERSFDLDVWDEAGDVCLTDYSLYFEMILEGSSQSEIEAFISECL